ncbi:MAG: hypothetical protein GY833_12355 [Aestuariibacter sp.]|nr:hypothetical protein [Aestuariibacter sp.]
MLYNAIEGAVAGWSRNSLPVLIKLFGVPVTVIRQVAIEDTDDDSTVVEPAPVPEPTPEPVVEPEPVEEEEEYVPPAPTAPAGFMGGLYGGAISLSNPQPEPEPEPEPEPVQEVTVQEAVEEVYGSMAGDITIQDENPKYREETFETVIIPPRRDWVTAGTRNIGGFEAVEVFANNDLLPDDKITFKRSDGALFHYRVLHEKTLGITEELLTKTYLTPIEGEDSHGRR